MTIWHHDRIDLAALDAMGASSLAGHLGIEFTAIGEDSLTARMPVGPRTHQPFGRLHGGASVALAETVGSVAGMLTLDPAHQVAVGMEINANHVRPVSEGFVHGTATAEALGKTVQVWTVRIVDDRDRLVCLSRITLAVIPRPRA